MPAGALTVAWVNQRNTNFPQYAPGWAYIADGDIAQLSTDKTITDIKVVPVRYLPHLKRDALTPP